MTGLRGGAKGLAERLLADSGLPALSRRRYASRCLVLAFHNILGPGQIPRGDRPLHLPLPVFEEFLDLLTASHDVVALDALDGPPSGARPRAAITFDDAYAGAIRYGLPALAARGLPGTIFVSPGILGRPACWWDRLANPTTGLDPSIREQALGALRGEDDDVTRWALASGRVLAAAAEFRIATEGELDSAANQPGVTLGAHTWSHPNLATLSPDELALEFERPLRWLRERFLSTRPWLAYPYGITSARVAEGAQRAGYVLGFLVTGGWVNTSKDAPMHLPRWSVPAGLSRRGFILHASGVLGA
jgi:peptidoglycan/xylan/chitin deacetylase (PgdA/CDA1 family)